MGTFRTRCMLTSAAGSLVSALLLINCTMAHAWQGLTSSGAVPSRYSQQVSKVFDVPGPTVQRALARTAEWC